MQDAPNIRLNALITKYQATGMLEHVMLTSQGALFSLYQKCQPSINPLLSHAFIKALY